jgi:periplasmic copper chaperone A
MKRIAVILAGALACAITLLALAGAAAAHVTVTAPGATRGGGDQEITFRVPVEKNVDTVGLKVALPIDTPIASVLVEPVEGWTHSEKTVKLAKPIVTDDGDITEAVSEIDWTANAGHGLTPGEFGSFTIIAGQLPDAPTLTFKAIQTYSDGSSVDWTQTEAPGSTADLDNPAPVLTLAPSGAGSGASGAAGSASAAAAPKSASNTGPVILSIVALVVAAAALGLAIVSRARTSGTRATGTGASGARS